MKRYIILIPFIICLAFGPANAKILGDFNNDGKLTIADAIGFIRVLMGKDPAGDIGQEYLLASECQGQSDMFSLLLGTWAQVRTFDDGTGEYRTETETLIINEDSTFSSILKDAGGNILETFSGHFLISGNSFTGMVTEASEDYGGLPVGTFFSMAFLLVGDTFTLFYSGEEMIFKKVES